MEITPNGPVAQMDRAAVS